MQKIVNTKSYQVLMEIRNSPFLKYGMEPDIIALDNDTIIVIRDEDFSAHIWTLDDLKDEISQGIHFTDSESVKVIQYYKEVLSTMITYKRDLKIKEVLC